MHSDVRNIGARDSNPRPMDLKASVLPTYLMTDMVIDVLIDVPNTPHTHHTTLITTL